MQTPIKTRDFYRSWILAVLWVLQMLVEVAQIFIYSLAISEFNSYLAKSLPSASYNLVYSTSYEETQATRALVRSAVVAASIILSISIAFLLLHIIQITLYTRDRLAPSRHFSFELSRFAIWTVIFGLVLAAVARSNVVNSLATIVVTVVIWVLYLLSMVYASVVLHRYRQGNFNGDSVLNRNRETEARPMMETV